MPLKILLLVGICSFASLPAWAITVTGAQPHPESATNVTDQKVKQVLQLFVARVWDESPVVQAANAAVEAAKARADGAGRPLYNPSFEFDTERTDINITSVGISQTIDWSDKGGALSDIASREVKAAIADLSATRTRVAVETLNALARYQAARELRNLALRRSRIMQDFATTTEERQKAGDVSLLDASLARVAYTEALMLQVDADTRLVDAVADLRAVSGQELTDWPGLPETLPQLPHAVDVDEILSRLPDLSVLKRRMDVARAQVESARRERRADPTIGLRGGREDTENLVGVTLEIPLFIRNNFKSEVQAASHEAAREEQSFRDAYLRHRARLDGAMARYRIAGVAWQAWNMTGQSALVEQIELLEKMWQAGELEVSDYLLQAKQNVVAQVAATELAGHVWEAAIAWLEASGQVESWLNIDNTAHQKTNYDGE